MGGRYTSIFSMWSHKKVELKRVLFVSFSVGVGGKDREEVPVYT
jgi:hypothetical protein